MKKQKHENDWSWPVQLEDYDRATSLTDAERSFLGHSNPRVNYSGSRFPALAAVRRLVEPLDDVFRHIEVRKQKGDVLVALLLREMGKRQTSFWAWSDQQWIETMSAHRYFAGWLLALAYLLCDFQSLEQLPKRRHVFSSLAARVFGAIRFEALVTELRSELEALGYQPKTLRMASVTVARVLLFIRSVRIENISLEVLQEFHGKKPTVGVERCLTALSRVLASKNLIPGALLRPGPPRYLDEPSALLARVPEDWARQARHWYETSTSTPKMRITGYYRILNVGRWLQATYPDITSADQWTRATASAAIAMLATQKQGDWIHRRWKMTGPPGKLLAPGTRLHTINCVRTFFQDMQDWEAIPRRFDPYRAFRCPRSLTCLVGPDPRTIADDVWAKLIWAGLNLTEEDFLKQARFPGGSHSYPFEFVRALTMAWLFSGLRTDEIRRLRLGCIRWQEDSSGGQVCLLSVPVHKSGSAFTKPVDKLVGETIEAWEKVRPEQGKTIDLKTGEAVHYVFLFGARHFGTTYLNNVLIPALCKKAGVPASDVRGRITGHRARSTIATQLFNAKDPLSLFELQEWLGHKNPSSTQHYAKLTPTKLMSSYAKAGYFERNVRAIEVLIDQDVIRKGLGDKEPWKFFDLGHGYCSYDFFDQCPHRMACARCSFYVPKESSRAQMLEGHSNLLRLQQSIPLSEPELAAVTDGIAAYDKLLAVLADVAAPDGETPRLLSTRAFHVIQKQER
jgi:integrase